MSRKPKIKELDVLLYGRRIGLVEERAEGRLQLTYDQAWRSHPKALPLSLSMPLAASTHGDGPVRAFMWGLLPDNEQVLSRWSKRLQVSMMNPFSILAVMGEDCAGAVQFVPAGWSPTPTAGDEVEWLDEAAIAERLAGLRLDASTAGRLTRDQGHFSLAGAQPKTALYHRDGRWGIPLGDTPTTHILKPAMQDLMGNLENEHFCLRLASALGLNAVDSSVESFAGEVVISTRRYDRQPRLLPDGSVRTMRGHQEDTCQALGIPPTKKYESDGGPSVPQIMRDVLRHSAHPGRDRDAFMAAVAYNFLILGTDAHGKNYSMMLAAEGKAKLAPLYDIASVLPYPKSVEPRKARLAMSVDGRYVAAEILPRHWEALSVKAGYSPDAMMGILRDQIARLPDVASDVAAACHAEGLHHPILAEIVDGIAARCAKVASFYGVETTEAAPPAAMAL